MDYNDDTANVKDRRFDDDMLVILFSEILGICDVPGGKGFSASCVAYEMRMRGIDSLHIVRPGLSIIAMVVNGNLEMSQNILGVERSAKASMEMLNKAVDRIIEATQQSKEGH